MGNDRQDRRACDRGAEAASRRYGDALRAADGDAAERVALDCLSDGMSVETLYSSVIAPALWRVGSLWEAGAITAADEHLATALTHRVLASVFSAGLGRGAPRPGRILMAALAGQHHDLGLRMAADLLELGGYEVRFLGGDVPTEALKSMIASSRPDLVALSYTLPESESSLASTVARLINATPELPVLLGGQGVSDTDLPKGGRVVRVPAVDGLLALVETLLPEPEPGQHPRSAEDGQLDPDRSLAAGRAGDSPEGLLAGATEDASELVRRHARIAHSYRRLAYEDAITNGPNRRAFDDRLALLTESRSAAPVKVLMLDLDRFKRVNDTFGHAAGDRVLRAVAEAIQRCLRGDDFAARLGGDEFGLLLPHTDLAQAELVAERVRVGIKAAASGESITATIGIATLRGNSRQALHDADMALYRAKAVGGDRVVLAGRDE